MDSFTAIFDACVLYRAPVRDVILELSVEGIFRARWTEQIHDEWIRSLLEQRPDIRPEQLQRTRERMNLAVPDAVISGYEPLVAGLS